MFYTSGVSVDLPYLYRPPNEHIYTAEQVRDMEIRVRSRKFHDLATYPFGTPPRGECLVYMFCLRDVKPQRPSKDPVADWKMLAKYSKVDTYLPQLTTKVCIRADYSPP